MSTRQLLINAGRVLLAINLAACQAGTAALGVTWSDITAMKDLLTAKGATAIDSTTPVTAPRSRSPPGPCCPGGIATPCRPRPVAERSFVSSTFG